MSNTIKNHLASNENGNDDSEMSENVNVALNLEVHPERQPYSTNPEGIEEALKDLTPKEEFAELVRRWWLTKKQEEQKEAQAKEPSKKKQKTTQNQTNTTTTNTISTKDEPKPHPWHSVLIQLISASRELEALSIFAEKVQGRQTFGQFQAAKQTASKEAFNTEFSKRVVRKRDALKNASKILKHGASSLRTIAERERIYFDELSAIRSRWLVSKIVVANQKVVGKVLLEYGYRSVGGWLPTGEIELQSKQNGSVQMMMPAHFALNDLYISNSYLNIAKLKQLSRFFFSPLHNDFLEIDGRLFQSQWSEFCAELFAKIRYDFQSASVKYGTSLRLIGNELILFPESEQELKISLFDEKKAEQLKQLLKEEDNMTDSNAPMKPDQFQSRFHVLEIFMSCLLYREFISANDNLKITDKRALLKQPNIIENIILFHQNQIISDQIRFEFDKFSQNVPGIIFHLLGNPNVATNNSYVVRYLNRIRLQVRAEGDKILCDEVSLPFSSVSELMETILFSMSKSIIAHVFAWLSNRITVPSNLNKPNSILIDDWKSVQKTIYLELRPNVKTSNLDIIISSTSVEKKTELLLHFPEISEQRTARKKLIYLILFALSGDLEKWKQRNNFEIQKYKFKAPLAKTNNSNNSNNNSSNSKSFKSNNGISNNNNNNLTQNNSSSFQQQQQQKLQTTPMMPLTQPHQLTPTIVQPSNNRILANNTANGLNNNGMMVSVVQSPPGFQVGRNDFGSDSNIVVASVADMQSPQNTMGSPNVGSNQTQTQYDTQMSYSDQTQNDHDMQTQQQHQQQHHQQQHNYHSNQQQLMQHQQSHERVATPLLTPTDTPTETNGNNNGQLILGTGAKSISQSKSQYQTMQLQQHHLQAQQIQQQITAQQQQMQKSKPPPKKPTTVIALDEEQYYDESEFMEEEIDEDDDEYGSNKKKPKKGAKGGVAGKKKQVKRK